MSKLHDELWAKYKARREEPHGDDWMPPVCFRAALDEAMEMQRKACAEAHTEALKTLTPKMSRPVREMVLLEAIKNARVEDIQQ